MTDTSADELNVDPLKGCYRPNLRKRNPNMWKVNKRTAEVLAGGAHETKDGSVISPKKVKSDDCACTFQC